MPRRAEISRQINVRYLNALANTRTGTPLTEAVQDLCRPVCKNGKRFRALNPLNPLDGLLIQAIARGEWLINGFRNRDIQNHFYTSKSRGIVKWLRPQILADFCTFLNRFLFETRT